MSSITSNAYNFGDFVNSGVDPRTGMYSMSLSLGEFVSHKGSGITIPLNIHYDPSSSVDTGFGRGWSLNLSHFDWANSRLKLSTGQSFKVQWNNSTGEYDLLHRGLKDVRVFYDSVKSEIQISYKDGRHEFLDYYEGMLKRIVTPQGLDINFEYGHYRGKQVLWSIKDGTRQFAIDWWTNEYEAVATNYLNDETVQTFIFYKYDNDRVLKYFASPLMSELTAIEYKHFEDCGYKVISKVATSSGKIEEIEYRQGHNLPIRAPIRSVPFAHRTIVHCGENQHPQITTYKYSDRNYLGFGSDRKWTAGEDTLFKAKSNYVYTTEQIVNDSKIIRRTYNKYHLLELEQFLDGSFLYQEIDYKYYANLDQGIEYQVPQYSLLKSKTTKFISKSGYVQNVNLEFDYDEYANLVRETKANGSIIERTYFPLAGSDDCPAEPNGMVSLLKEERFIPYDNGQVRTKSYQYSSIPTLSGDNYFVVLIGENLGNQSYQYEYFRNTSNANEYGRLMSSTHNVNSYSSRIEFSYDFFDHSFKTTEKQTSFDGISYSISRTQDYMFFGTIEFIDESGNVSTCEYDEIGRLTKETMYQHTDYEAFAEYSYSVGSNANSVTKTDFLGNSELIELNNVGNVVRISNKIANSDFKVTKENWFNSFGLIAKTDDLDWIEDQSIRVSTSYEHDYNGQVSRIVHQDGREETIIQDAANMTVSVSQTGLISEVSQYDLSGQLIEKVTKDDMDRIIARTTNSYDSDGNLVAISDTDDRKIEFTYDAFNRVKEVIRTVDDQKIFERYEYPEFTNKACVSRSYINDRLMGSRVHDGLLRVTSETSTSGTVAYQYSGCNMMPSKKITASGEILNLSLDSFSQMPRMISVEGSSELTSKFEYDKKLSIATSSMNANSKNDVVIDSYGRIISNTVSLNDGVDRTAKATLSMKGKVVSETDFFNNTKHFEYDALGRLESVSENFTGHKVTETKVYYDNFSRASRYEIYDRGHIVDLQLQYNAIGFETYREVNVDSELALSITQEYNTSLLVERRIYRDENGTTTETYSYDNFNRLIDYSCEGQNLPVDVNGNAIVRQTYSYDIYGNIIQAVSYFHDSSNVASYEYSPQDNMRLMAITNSHSEYPDLRFEYDANGNMLIDELGRYYFYDAIGRVSTITDASRNVLTKYAYDSGGKAVSQTVNNNILYMLHLHTTLTNEVCDGVSAGYSSNVPGITTKHVSNGISQVSIGNSLGSNLRTATISNDDIELSESKTYTPYGQ